MSLVLVKDRQKKGLTTTLPVALGKLQFLPGDRAELEAFKPSKDSHYTLVAWIDSAILLRKNLEWLLAVKELFHQPPIRLHVFEPCASNIIHL